MPVEYQPGRHDAKAFMRQLVEKSTNPRTLEVRGERFIFTYLVILELRSKPRAL